MYITTCLRGGLGNQLFQYAAGRSLAERTGARLILDGSRFHTPGARPFALQGFAMDAAITSDGYFRSASREGGDPEDRKESIVFRESTLDYDPRFEELTAPRILVGYWQSEKYFLRIAETLKFALRRISEPVGENARWLEMLRGSSAVCVHVRRGDFLDPRIMQSHGPCSIDYYRRAMERVRASVESPRFFVFSDDWDWARRNFSTADAILVDANGPEAAGEELRLMAACRHHIIANSTLSWWAAWLAKHESQLVIAPDPWFASGLPTPDLLPKTWSMLPRG